MDKQIPDSIPHLTPASLQQLVSTTIARLISAEAPAVAGLIRVTGILADPGRPRGQWHYGVVLADSGAQVLVDVPASLVSARKLVGGKWVSVIGALVIRTTRLGGLEMRIQVSDASGDAMNAKEDQAAGGSATLEQLKSLSIKQYAFPVPNGRPLAVALIQSSSSSTMVVDDCMAELDRLGNAVVVTHLPVNILDPEAIATAIKNAAGDLVMLIRGGGRSDEFGVFDDYRVLSAMANKQCYRVIGLGHSANHTLLQFVVEHSARTPAQAGQHVRETIEHHVAQWRAYQERIRKQHTTHPNEPGRSPPQQTSQWPKALAWAGLFFALVLGFLAGRGFG